MKIWKMLIGLAGLVGGLFAMQASKKKEVKELEVVIKDNKKKEKEVEKEIKVLEKDKVTNKKEITKAKRKLTRSQNEVKKMEKAYEEDDIESAADFLKKYKK
jgi:chromosome segregation ATPase